jgi:8-oxo-dGTP diphosphatase
MARESVWLQDSDGSSYLADWDTERAAPVLCRRWSVPVRPGDARMARVMRTGTSFEDGRSARDVLVRNRAGLGETVLTVEQIIDVFCRGRSNRYGFDPTGEDVAAVNEWYLRNWPRDLHGAAVYAAPDPHRDARVGVAVAVVRDERLLLGKRIASFGGGSYQHPGGKPAPGERLAETAARELREETGLTARRLWHVTSQVDVMPETGMTWRTYFFCAEVAAALEPENREPHKNEGWAWFPLAALPDRMFATDDATVDAVRRVAAAMKRAPDAVQVLQPAAGTASAIVNK